MIRMCSSQSAIVISNIGIIPVIDTPHMWA
jgi:hypothetical protein